MDYLKDAHEIDPLSNVLASEIATTLKHMGKYLEAERYYERAVSLAPDIPFPYYFKALLYLQWEGNIEKARAVLSEAVQNANGIEEAFIVVLLIQIDVYDEKYKEALNRLSAWTSESFDTHFYFIPKALLIDQIEDLLSIPGEISVHILRIDPVWNPLRKHPRFIKLLEAGK